MKVIVTRILIAACALYLSGAHWGVLQVTAWTGMLVSRTQDAGFSEAVKTTFDGQHPCRMCSAISEGRQQEEQDTTALPGARKLAELKLVLLPAGHPMKPLESGEMDWAETQLVRGRTVEAPPTPPPVA